MLVRASSWERRRHCAIYLRGIFVKILRLRLSVGLAGVLLLGACSAAEESAPVAPAETPSAAAEEVPVEDEFVPVEFTVAQTVTGVSTIPILAAIDELRAMGYVIYTPTLSAPELNIEGVASGRFEMSHGNSQGTLQAMAQGAPLKWVSMRVANEWTMFVKNSITSCEQLDGQRLAIHSEGGVSTAMVRLYIAETCPQITPNYIIIPGSENRAQALLLDEIDASPVELAEAVQLQTLEGDRFSILSNFSVDVPDLIVNAVYANDDFIAEHPQAVADLVAAQLEIHRRIAEEPGFMKTLIERYIPDFDPTLIDLVAETYSDGFYFPADGGLSDERVQFTLDFFASRYDGTLTPADVWTDQFLTN